MRQWSRYVRRLRLLSADQRLVCLQTLGLIPLLRIQLKTNGLRSTASHWKLDLNPIPSGQIVDAATRERARSVSMAVGHVARRIPGGTHCLTRSLVLLYLLKKRNIVGRLQIGVTRPSAFAAHAWIELLDGEPLNDSANNISDYRPVSGINP
jgi:hypothetical protein